MTDSSMSSDSSGRIQGDKGRCPGCGSSALVFIYADGNNAPVRWWWPDGRPANLLVDGVEDVAVSRKEYEAAVEAAPERDPEYPEFCGALHCGACGEEFDKPEFVDEID